MEIIVTRDFKKDGYTIGSLLLDGKWFCNTLEPPVGTVKEMRTSGSGKAIPPGVYKVRLVFSPKFQQYLPKLEDIPPKQGGLEGLGTRSGILIHAGNSIRDTRGCILVGKNTRPGKVLQSRDVLNSLINTLRKAENKREEVTIEIKS